MLFARSASGQNTHQSDAPYAEIVFYRAFIPKMKAPIKKVPIYIGNTLVYSLKANTIWRTKIFKEGKHYVAIDEAGETTVLFNVTFGNTYYFKCEVVPGLWFGKPTILLVAPDIGKGECETLEKKLTQKN